MSKNQAGGARRPLFSAAKRMEILKQVVGKPSGFVVDLGGFAIDLVPLATADTADILAIVDRVGGLFDQTGKNGGISEGELAQVIAGQGERVQAIVRRLLRASVEVDGDEGEAVFAEWFDRLPTVAMIRALLPVILSANGLDALGKTLAARAAAATSVETAPSSP
ncbi:MAG: hypothetical protein JWN27_2892 [Candidatus Eremiobacteraeota bacterium]|nr:hypothetical protein [Candidatus Eremiobacteraeota bacterium]